MKLWLRILRAIDFTINAIALDSEGRVIDYFNGLEDLKNRELRTVGQASQRFAEDALRMFRACLYISIGCNL